MSDTPDLLRVENLCTELVIDGKPVRVVDGVSFHLGNRETLAIVGESGCGKSMTALSLLRLVPEPPGRITGGSVKLRGSDLLALSRRDMLAVRGNRIAMVFQEPMTSLNPLMTIGDQIVEAIVTHTSMQERAAWDRAIELLELVRIPDARRRARDYPHMLSGGMRQRVVIAIALACRPLVLVADEPTTALDVTIQAQILRLLADVQKEFGTGIILITHDLGVVAEIADRVVVMYAGRKVEEAAVDELFKTPRHPYTQGLLSATIRPDKVDHKGRLAEISGRVPTLSELPQGCAFADRCALAMAVCREEQPEQISLSPKHVVACHAVGRCQSGETS